MKQIRPPTQNLSGWKWYLDTHIIDSQSARELFELYTDGWVYLEAPDTVLVEITAAKDKSKKEELLDSISQFPIPLGPITLGSSLVGFGVVGSNDDQRRIDKVHSIVWSGHTFGNDSTKMESNKAARSRVRDTLIVANALRHGVNGLITHDEDLTASSVRLRDAGYLLEFLGIEEATRRVRDFKTKFLSRRK